MLDISYTLESEDETNWRNLHPEGWTSYHVIQWMYDQAEASKDIGTSVCLFVPSHFKRIDHRLKTKETSE